MSIRYNLTVDETLAKTIETKAKIENTNELDVIRQILEEKLYKTTNIPENIFFKIEVNNLSGKLVKKEDGFILFLIKDKSLVDLYSFNPFCEIKTIEIIEVPKNLLKCFIEIKNSFVRFNGPGDFNGGLFAIKIKFDEYLVVRVKDVSANTINSDILKSKMEDNIIVNSETFFKFFKII